jgi:hypothetical protein
MPVLVGCVITAGVLLGAPGATAATPATVVGGLDLALYCTQHGYTGVPSTALVKGGEIGPNFAYANWACVKSDGTGVPITPSGPAPSLTDACHIQYPGRTSVAQTANPNDAYAWQCYTAELTARSTTTTTTTTASTPTTTTGASSTTAAATPPVTGAAAPPPPPAGTAKPPNQRVSTLASSLTTPRKAFSSIRRSIENAVIAAVAVLFITFPSQLFNHTFDENYADISAWWARRFKLVAKLRNRVARSKSTLLRDTLIAVIVVLAGGVFGTLLDPHAGLTRASAMTYASVICSTSLAIAVTGYVTLEYRRRRGRPTTFHLHALSAGLLIAGFCVLVSRLVDFEPGYLYGRVCGVAFAGSLSRTEQGHAVTLAVLATLTTALLAWVAWLPLNHLAEHPHEAWAIVFSDDLAGAVFTGGMIGSTIGCLPLRFLPGGTIAAWHRGAWAVVFGLVTFLVLEVMLNPGRGGHPGHAPIVTAIVLFGVFGARSVAFYAHFARTRRKVASAP